MWLPHCHGVSMCPNGHFSAGLSGMLQVPNIKFTVAKMLERLVPLVDAAVTEHTIKPCLLDLAEDSDADVQYFAKHALVSCEVVTAA